MLRRSARLVLAVAALAAVAGAAAGKARADGPILFDFCKAAAPHATLSFGAGVPSVEATSPSASYAGALCPRYLVDIHVPTSSSGGNGYFDEFVVGGGYAGPSSGSGLGGLPLAMVPCEGYRGYLRVYRKSALGGDFAYVGGGNTRGTWIADGEPFGPFCAVVKDAGYVDLPVFSPPPLFPVVYRVAVGATVRGSWQRVRAGASHAPIIP